MECGEYNERKMVATLQSRKGALEAKLKEKTDELKKLCIQEAELTGLLPPETPLQPGESPPVFRRRIGTSFAYPENLLNKLKSKEEESVAKLELECRIQMSIAEAALGLANDENANKTIRRKHRLMYQQSQKRLAELETKLNLLRQSMRLNNGNQLKYRKKPRPPLQMDGESVDGVVSSLRETANGTCVKNSYCQTERLSDDVIVIGCSPFGNRNTRAAIGVYNSFGKSYNSTISPTTSTLPSAYTRPSNRQIIVDNAGKNNHDCNSSYRLSSSPGFVPGREQIPYHHHSTIGLCGRENRNWVDDSILLRSGDGNNNNNNSNNHNNKMIASFGGTCYYSNNFYGAGVTATDNDEKIITNRTKSKYGSLDRRRIINSHASPNRATDYQQQHYSTLQHQSQYRHPQHSRHQQYSPTSRHPSPQYIFANHSGTPPPLFSSSQQQQQQRNVILRADANENTAGSGNVRLTQNVILLPNQTYPENSLMRTQSLGNVEQQHHVLHRPDKLPDTYSLGAGSITVNGNNFCDNESNYFQSNTLGRKTKEKEWRETSLDYNVPNNVIRQTPPLLHPRANKIPVPSLPRGVSPTSSSPRFLPTSTPPQLPPALLKVVDKCSEDTTTTTTSNRSPMKSPNLIDTCVPFESPKNHTVVEIGKWQPYREVSKPFEMSDFYKYSTKFRKNNNNNSHLDRTEHDSLNHNGLNNLPEKVYIANGV